MQCCGSYKAHFKDRLDVRIFITEPVKGRVIWDSIVEKVNLGSQIFMHGNEGMFHVHCFEFSQRRGACGYIQHTKPTIIFLIIYSGFLKEI